MDKPLTCVTVFPACTYMRLWCGFVGLGFSVVWGFSINSAQSPSVARIQLQKDMPPGR